MKTLFCDWDRRPAVLFTKDDGVPMSALAMLEPGADWVPVDASDVWSSAGTFADEASFAASFKRRFGTLAIPPAPNSSAVKPSVAAE